MSELESCCRENYIHRWNEYCRSRENLLLWQTNFGGTIWVNWTLTCLSLLVCLFLSPSLYFSFHQSLSLSISFGLLSQSNSVGVHILCVILLGNESDTRRERWKEAVASSSSANKLLFIVSRPSFFFCSLLYCCAASPTTMVTCMQKWEEEERIWTTEAERTT